MTIKTIAVIFLISIGRVLSQYQSLYVGSNAPDLAYDKTRQEIMHNYLNNKPLLNYVPVYNTDYGHWHGEHHKHHEDTTKKPQADNPDMDFEKFAEVINRLKTKMQNLSHKTKHIYEWKLKELGEVKKLHENLKVFLHTTDTLKNNLHQNQKQLTEMEKNPENPDGCPSANPDEVEHFLKAIEGMESMVRNINYKHDGKLGM